MKKRYCITFGQKSPFRHCWVEVEAENMIEAKEKVDYALGDGGWSNAYPHDEFMNRHKQYFEGGMIGQLIK